MTYPKALLLFLIPAAFLFSGCLVSKVATTTVGVVGQAAKTTIKVAGGAAGAVTPTRPKEKPTAP